jgi:hypothetical protein
MNIHHMFLIFFIELISYIKDKVVVTSTVKREFYRNHKSCYHRQKKKFENVPHQLKKSTESTKTYNVHACQDTNLEILSYDSFPDLSCISNKAKVDFCWCFVIIALMPSFIIVVINVLFRQGFYLRNSFWIH